MPSNFTIPIRPANQTDKKNIHLHLSANKESDPIAQSFESLSEKQT